MTIRARTPLYYLAMSIVIQAFAFGAAVLISHSAKITSANGLLLFAAVLALTLSRILKLSRPWQALNLLLLPAVYLSQSASIPPWLLLLALCVSILIYLPTFWTHVPFYPTSVEMYEEILNRLPEDADFSFIDLGSGYGTLLSYLSRRRPRGKFVGSEIAPLPYLISRLRFLGRGTAVQITLTSFWNLDLSEFDFIYAFLAPDPMPRLWAKVQQEASAKSVFMTNTFKVDAKPDELVTVSDAHSCTLYIHKNPGRRNPK